MGSFLIGLGIDFRLILCRRCLSLSASRQVIEDILPTGHYHNYKRSKERKSDNDFEMSFNVWQGEKTTV